MSSGLIPHKLPNAAGSQLTLSTTAVKLRDAIRTASSDATFAFQSGANALNIQAEDGDIRYLRDGNVPTTSVGMFIQTGVLDNTIRGGSLDDIWLIATSGTPKVNITIGETIKG